MAPTAFYMSAASVKRHIIEFAYFWNTSLPTTVLEKLDDATNMRYEKQLTNAEIKGLREGCAKFQASMSRMQEKWIGTMMAAELWMAELEKRKTTMAALYKWEDKFENDLEMYPVVVNALETWAEEMRERDTDAAKPEHSDEALDALAKWADELKADDNLGVGEADTTRLKQILAKWL